MSAVNFIRFHDRAILITDGLVCADGRPYGVTHKALCLPHSGMAIGFRGARPMASAVCDLISLNAKSLDDLRRRFVEILKPELDQVAPIWTAKFGPQVMDIDIGVIGWSDETQAPSSFAFSTSDLHASCGLYAWQPWDMAAYFSPSTPELAQRFARTDFSDDDAIALIERQMQMPPGDVGAFCQLTTVRKHSIDTRILKRWS